MKFRTIFILMLGILTVGMQGIACSPEENPLASDFVLTTLEGDTIRLSDYRGKVVIIDIWDTWCPPCRKGIPEFIEMFNTYRKKGFVVLGLALGQRGIDKVRSFAVEYKMDYPVAVLDQKVLDDYGPIRGIPTAFLIDREGRIVKKYVGYRPKQEFENDIESIL